MYRISLINTTYFDIGRHDRTDNACSVSTSVVPYKALEKFSKALYGTTGGTYSPRVFRPVMFGSYGYYYYCT